MRNYLIKIYHSFQEWQQAFRDFLQSLNDTIKEAWVMAIWINYLKGEYYFSMHATEKNYALFESQFYSNFNNFQITKDDKGVLWFDEKKTAIGELVLKNHQFFPFKFDPNNNETDFIYNFFRKFENFDVISDKFWFFIVIEPIDTNSTFFYVKASLDRIWFKIKLMLQFYKYMFNFKIKKWWKQEWFKHFAKKIHDPLFKCSLYMVCQSTNKKVAWSKIQSIANNFKVFDNYPLNEFVISRSKTKLQDIFVSKPHAQLFSHQEIASFFHFPMRPQSETALMKVTSKKLALPIWVPTFDSHTLENGEIIVKEHPQNVNILGISDYRSITVPVWIYDEDRLRHVYVVGKTWVGKSKFIVSLLANDIKQWKGLAVIDPHWDLFDEVIMHIPEERKKDVIIFDPTDDKYPFCLNPLDVAENESKQVLAKWFIDIFKKFFGANRNSMLEHVLRMIFLALLDKPWSTLFDIIRALTDKDFRYEMIESIEDDVVRNFWTNEFAGWSQQFNTQAIMPILNKVGQLLSIEALKNIFASPVNKLDLRSAMDESKILLIKLSKWKLQEDIMWFLWAMFVTKIFQAAMSRQNVEKSSRVPFYFYVDEFQNFATETFNEILSEARKYGLWLCVAHQFISQIPKDISWALFGNVWNLISFRISSEDALYMKQHFDPFVDGYDLANLSQREFYCKMQVRGEVKDPFSLRSTYMEDPKIAPHHAQEMYKWSRSQYCRTLQEAKKIIQAEQKDVMHAIEEFIEPMI